MCWTFFVVVAGFRGCSEVGGCVSPGDWHLSTFFEFHQRKSGFTNEKLFLPAKNSGYQRFYQGYRQFFRNLQIPPATNDMPLSTTCTALHSSPPLQIKHTKTKLKSYHIKTNFMSIGSFTANDFRARLRFPRVAREPPRHFVPAG
jgi:hypothetical protein